MTLTQKYVNNIKVISKKIAHTVKETIMTVVHVIKSYVVKPLSSKENFKQMVNNLKERIKNFSLIFRKKESSDTTKSDKDKFKSWLNKFGIDADQIKTTIKKQTFTMMVLGNLRLDRVSMFHSTETSLAHISMFDNIRREFSIYKQTLLIRLYNWLTSDLNKERWRRFKEYFN